MVSGSCPYAHNETAAFPMLILDLDDPDGHEVHLHVRNHVPEIGHVRQPVGTMRHAKPGLGSWVSWQPLADEVLIPRSSRNIHAASLCEALQHHEP